MTTVIDSLAASLADIPVTTPLCVGLSGGLDSIVLLHALTKLSSQYSIRAIHVNHQLSQSAAQWQQHCKDFCASLNVDFVAATVDVKQALSESGAGIEAAARQLRYEVFASHLFKNEVLLLAHHLDDQAETLLLRLMRGAGVHGLRAMPQRRNVGAGSLLRPFLQLSQNQLLDYGQLNNLSWVEDESNSDSRFDRNFCRHEVFPVLATRWPAYRESWNKSLQLISEAAEIVDELAEQDILSARRGTADVLSLSSIQQLTPARQRSALRFWLASMEAPEIGWKPLNELVSKLKTHQGGEQNLIDDSGFQLVAYREELHALRCSQQPKPPLNLWHLASEPNFTLPENGELIFQCSGASTQWLAHLGDVSIRYRNGGERCKIQGRPTKTLKQLFQEAAVPPWLRDRLPLIYSGDSLVYIPMLGASESFGLSKQDRDMSASIIWRQPRFNWL
jgi:tRNA(Ile)-lysidine synthase